MIGISLEDAIREISSVKVKVDIVTRSLDECLGMVLAEDIYAPINQPPFDRSPLDGYAIRGEDTLGQEETILDVIGCVYAGSVFRGEVEKGEAVRIMTGAPIPSGANAIVKQEDTDYGEKKVKVYQSLKPFDNYCYAGEDIKKDQSLMTKGEMIDYQHIGVLASMGLNEVNVIKPISIGLICTGDEVIEPGSRLREGKIFNSNRYILSSKLRKLGYIVKYIGEVEDNPKEVARVLAETIDTVDVILTTGGVSVGVKDIMHDVLEELDAKRLFWKVDIQPGTPMLSAVYKDKPIIALSGNPFAAITTFEVVVRPVLSLWMGCSGKGLAKKRAIIKGSFDKKCKRRRFVRAFYEDGVVTIPSTNHSSGALYSMLMCNALIDLPKGTEGVMEGQEVDVVLV